MVGRYRKWASEIDLVSLSLIFLLMGLSLFLVATAGCGVEKKIGASEHYFITKQSVFIPLGIVIMIVFSVLSERQIKRVALCGFILCAMSMVLVLFVGDEAKGAKRWIAIYGFTIQPSEYLKPFYAVFMSAIISKIYQESRVSNLSVFIVCYIAIVALLSLQPDFGMSVIITLMTLTNLFIAGLPMYVLLIAFLIASGGGLVAYLTLDHVAARINRFLLASENYQITKSLESYSAGGLFGKGPGGGTVKGLVPDSHTDFIFCVVGEELGAVMAIGIIAIYALLIFRFCSSMISINSIFKLQVVSSLVMMIASQSIFNIGVTLDLFPTKGMTLPLLSYGGSSMISCSIVFGLMLNLTKSK